MMTRREFLVRTGAAAALAGFPGIAAGAAREPGGAAGRVLAKLKTVANSKSYYWAWTHPWMDPWPMAGDRRFAVKKGEGFAPLPTADVRLDCAYTQYTDGRRVLLAYSDLAAVTGTWHAPAYYAANRATLTAAIRRFWKECGGVTVFSWHMDHPYCETGFKQASYRYKLDGDDRNAIKQILDGTGRPCGTGSIDGKTHRTPFANPRPPRPTLKTVFPASVPPLCQRRPSEPALKKILQIALGGASRAAALMERAADSVAKDGIGCERPLRSSR